MISIEKIKEYTKCPQFGDLNYGEWGTLRIEQRQAYRDLIDIIEGMEQEIERINKENNDLRKLYQRTYKHLFEIGNDELARYFQAQIDECPTFYVEPIIDYYEEIERLNNIIKEAREYIKENCSNYYVEKPNYRGVELINIEELLEILDKGE